MRMLTAIAKAGNIANTTGEISIDDREIVVDIKDLPGEFKHLEQSDYVIFRNRRFEIKRLIFFDSCKGYYLQVREYNTQSLRRNININIKDKFLLVQYLETTNVQSL